MTIHSKHLAAAIALSLVAAPIMAAQTAMPPPEDTATTTTTTTTTKHHYVYYSDHDIYFAPETKTYYWMSNGTWIAGTTLPVEYQPYVRTKGVTIELDTEKPYERHEYVIAHYKHHHDDD